MWLLCPDEVSRANELGVLEPGGQDYMKSLLDTWDWWTNTSKCWRFQIRERNSGLKARDLRRRRRFDTPRLGNTAYIRLR
jgi:hypothetical protein